MDLYAQELKVWKECWVKWEGEEGGDREGKEGEVVEGRKEEVRRVPGAFEW
jgi:hypothetical protein